MEFGAWDVIDLLMCVFDMGSACMAENNAASAGIHLDGFGAHFGELGIGSGLIDFEDPMVIVFLG